MQLSLIVGLMENWCFETKMETEMGYSKGKAEHSVLIFGTPVAQVLLCSAS